MQPLQKLREYLVAIWQADRPTMPSSTPDRPADNDYSPEALAVRMERIEVELAALQETSRGTKKAVWGTWFYSEIISPILAVGVIIFVVYMGMQYIETNYLGGISIVDKVGAFLETLPRMVPEHLENPTATENLVIPESPVPETPNPETINAQ